MIANKFITIDWLILEKFPRPFSRNPTSRFSNIIFNTKNRPTNFKEIPRPFSHNSTLRFSNIILNTKIPRFPGDTDSSHLQVKSKYVWLSFTIRRFRQNSNLVLWNWNFPHISGIGLPVFHPVQGSYLSSYPGTMTAVSYFLSSRKKWLPKRDWYCT